MGRIHEGTQRNTKKDKWTEGNEPSYGLSYGPAFSLRVPSCPFVDHSSRNRTMLRVAYEEADITPPMGGSMPGYFRDRKATGTLDPLKAKVLYLSQDKENIALVACDLIGMGADTVGRIRKAVAASKNPPRHVWVHCTHSHTGGMTPRSFTSDAEKIYPNFYEGRVDDKWVQQLIDRAAAAVAMAASRAA